MSLEVHIDWNAKTHLVGRLHPAQRGSSFSFEYAPEWLQREDAFAIDPTSLPMQRGAHHGGTLFGAIRDCGPDRWGRVLIERAVRKKVLAQKPYHDMDYVLALDDASRIGALRFRLDANSPFLAATSGKLPPLLRLNALLRATDAIHGETETAQDLRFLLGAGSPLGGARPKAALSLAHNKLRNHGFLMREPGRWSLSPAYDLNPVPEMDRARTSKTTITEDQEEPSIDAALAAAVRFGLKAAESKKILRDVFTAVSDWRNTGRKLRLKASTLDAYASAFEHSLMDEAGRLLGK